MKDTDCAPMRPPLIPFSQTLRRHMPLCTDSLFRLISNSKQLGSYISLSMDSVTYISSDPQEKLDQLSACFHFLSYIPNSLLVSVSALSHLGHIQFTWLGFLDKVKIAAGKSGTDTSKRDARGWLSARINEDPIRARSILLHAGQLNSLISRFTFE